MGQVDRYTEADIMLERSDLGAEDMDSGDTCCLSFTWKQEASQFHPVHLMWHEIPY